ncbi:MAG: hypothetical protein AAF989_02650 [Planctomycetota bacterium]
MPTHSGHSLEAGILSRAREWVDVAPWIRLGRVMRLAGSPVAVGLVIVAGVIWHSVLSAVSGESTAAALFEGQVTGTEILRAPGDWSPWLAPLGLVRQVLWNLNPMVLFWADGTDNSKAGWMRVLSGIGIWSWTALVWTPVVLFLCRQGALLTTRRDLMGTSGVMRLAIHRTPRAWLSMLTPLACVLVLLVPVIAFSWSFHVAVDRILGPSSFLGGFLAMLAAVVLIPAGVLAMGSFVALPSAFAALINEPHPDSLDALSRGYENLLRRPLSLVFYVAMALACVFVAGNLARGVSVCAANLADSVNVGPAPLQAVGQENPDLESSYSATLTRLLQFFPACVAFALSWGMVGGTYLLLRRDCGGQEVEDLWIPERKSTTELPELPRPN